MSRKGWYGMRKAMQARGTWKHSVPRQEEGEPPSKQPRTESGADRAAGDTAGADPEEGTSKQALEDLGK